MSKGDPPEVGGAALWVESKDAISTMALQDRLTSDKNAIVTIAVQNGLTSDKNAIVTTAVQREVYLVRRESRGMVREQGGTRALAWGVEDQ